MSSHQCSQATPALQLSQRVSVFLSKCQIDLWRRVSSFESRLVMNARFLVPGITPLRVSIRFGSSLSPIQSTARISDFDVADKLRESLSNLAVAIAAALCEYEPADMQRRNEQLNLTGLSPCCKRKMTGSDNPYSTKLCIAFSTAALVSGSRNTAYHFGQCGMSALH